MESLVLLCFSPSILTSRLDLSWSHSRSRYAPCYSYSMHAQYSTLQTSSTRRRPCMGISWRALGQRQSCLARRRRETLVAPHVGWERCFGLLDHDGARATKRSRKDGQDTGFNILRSLHFNMVSDSHFWRHEYPYRGLLKSRCHGRR